MTEAQEWNLSLRPITRLLSISMKQVQAVVQLLDEGNTVPFITRYRKDETEGLDEVQIYRIQTELAKQRQLMERKQTILRSIESQGKLTPELAEKIRAAATVKRLEDLYFPFKTKKQTLATVARRSGLEPLAEEILSGAEACADLSERAKDFVNAAKDLLEVDDVLTGVGHILAEVYSENAELRQKLRDVFQRTAKILTTRVETEKSSPAPVEATSEENTPEETPVPVEAAAEETSTEEILVKEALAEEHPVEEIPVEAASEAPEKENPEKEAPAVSKVDARTEARAKAKELRAKRKQKEQEWKQKAFQDYFAFEEMVRKIPPHRVLAINRGEAGNILRVKIEADVPALRECAENTLLTETSLHADFQRAAIRDALSRLILPAMEREARRELTENAESHAVGVFARNLRNLLLQAPIHGRRVLAMDPGFKNGCKLVALDQFGNFLESCVIYLVGGAGRVAEAKQTVCHLVKKYDLSLIAIGNGTACRDTENFVGALLTEELTERDMAYVIVNEAGASVYSTSTLGREEFPEYDATLRGAISIGRRLQDPLSELVKIDPASIGVGLYQHDVKAKHLRESLEDVVISCVNFVGVDVNMASPALLRFVSGLNQLHARKIYEYRRANGPFRNREQLKNVPGIGEATFVQAAGFLKISKGDNSLDATWIHPESYALAEKVLAKLGVSVEDIRKSPQGLEEKIAALDLSALAKELETGERKLQDILAQLVRPGRDPREDLPKPLFKKGILKLEDLTAGMELIGTVLNVVDFGAFVDIGLHESGLVHVSQLADKFVRDPHDALAVGDVVRTWVVGVDKNRRRVSLTMVDPTVSKETPKPTAEKPKKKRRRGKKHSGTPAVIPVPVGEPSAAVAAIISPQPMTLRLVSEAPADFVPTSDRAKQERRERPSRPRRERPVQEGMEESSERPSRPRRERPARNESTEERPRRERSKEERPGRSSRGERFQDDTFQEDRPRDRRHGRMDERQREDRTVYRYSTDLPAPPPAAPSVKNGKATFHSFRAWAALSKPEDSESASSDDTTGSVE